MDSAKQLYGENDRFQLAASREDALVGADALVIATEWRQFRSPDWELLRSRLTDPIIFDGRNIYDPARVKREGFTYYGIGLGERPHRAATIQVPSLDAVTME
jgi:UDPglucose 6-dehydrogenase